MQKLLLKPGVNVEKTALLNEASWSASSFIRFFQGLLQKLGGWSRISSTALIGTCRGMLAWADLTGNVYVGAGTEQRLQVYSAGNVFDITPIRATTNPTPALAFVNGSNLMTITDTAHGAAAGDWIYLMTPAQTSSQTFSIPTGFYQIDSVVDVNNYKVTIPFTASASQTGDGQTPQYNTTNTSSTVRVTIAPDNGGFITGSVMTIEVPTTVGGLTLSGDYVVTISGGTMTIVAASGATSTTSANENSGNLRIEYLIQTGLLSPVTASGYGEGPYGFGPYGQGASSSTPTMLRQWSLGAWGRQLLASPSLGSLYVWEPVNGTNYTNPATIISQAPSINTGFFVAMPQQQVVGFGCTDPGTGAQDPMLVRWCDVADYTDWTATAANQAGSFRIPRGSRIIGGIQGPQYGLLWTDLSLWAMQYIQPPLVYGFNEIATGCGLMSMRAQGILGTSVYWSSLNNFFLYANGSVQPLQCDVWDKVYLNINLFQQDKAFLAPNSHFGEFFFFYPSLTGTGEVDSYVKFTENGSLWDYGSLVRTAWIDQSVFGNPLGVDSNMLIQQHENGNDADGSVMSASATSGWFKVSDGTLFLFLERMLPDFVMTTGATVQITVQFADYQDDNPVSYGPYNVTSSTEYFIVRGRGRLARLTISSSDLGSFWRLGEMLYIGTPSGRR